MDLRCSLTWCMGFGARSWLGALLHANIAKMGCAPCVNFIMRCRVRSGHLPRAPIVCLACVVLCTHPCLITSSCKVIRAAWAHSLPLGCSIGLSCASKEAQKYPLWNKITPMSPSHAWHLPTTHNFFFFQKHDSTLKNHNFKSITLLVNLPSSKFL